MSRGSRGSKGGAGRPSSRRADDGPAGGRQLKTPLRTAKGRKLSSTRWLKRQLSDPYVAAARRRGYRARSAFKLAEIDDKRRLIKRGARVVDLGAAPGGWAQVALERAGPRGRLVGMDLQEVEPLAGATFLLGDVRDPDAAERLGRALAGPADLVLSDMAAPATGHAATDHLRTMALVEAALEIAERILAPGGGFVAKVLQGGTETELLARLKRAFARVQHVKPPASRKDSAELYVVATGFRGAPESVREDGDSPDQDETSDRE